MTDVSQQSQSLSEDFEHAIAKLERIVRSKTATIAGLYLIALLLLGTVAYKALVVAIVAAVLLRKAIAPNLVVCGGVLLFVVAAIDWTGALPITRWVNALVAVVDRTLT
ncbi:hypothetical protein ACVIHH_003678 [Bradyrhizobium sp. USDA 4518]